MEELGEQAAAKPVPEDKKEFTLKLTRDIWVKMLEAATDDGYACMNEWVIAAIKRDLRTRDEQ